MLTPDRISLNAQQQNAVDWHKALNVHASWFYGEPDSSGGIEVIALGEDFVWSLRIDTYGETDTSEATLGEFSTGIEV